MSNTKKITVVGAGYVGMAMAALFSQRYSVSVLDINSDAVGKINKGVSPIADPDIEALLESKHNISATLDGPEALGSADVVIVATPTDYDADLNKFDTTSVDETVAKASSLNRSATIVIKSTVPIGHTDNLVKLHRNKNILFSPEFLREGNALHDNLNPSRIIVGGSIGRAEEFSTMLGDVSRTKNCTKLVMGSTEAEAVKLFSNGYLAMRVAFFNELDSFCMKNELSTKDVIEGVCGDPRIGKGYANPSFGYGGYCFPKDTRQLETNFAGVNQSVISAIVQSNFLRKQTIANAIINTESKIVGVDRLVMKAGSDNFRSSAVFDVIEILKQAGIEILIYEPLASSELRKKYRVLDDYSQFLDASDLVITNRLSVDLAERGVKVFTRDVFGDN